MLSGCDASVIVELLGEIRVVSHKAKWCCLVSNLEEVIFDLNRRS